MSLQDREATTIKKSFNLGAMITGIAMIAIPVIVGIFVTKPELLDLLLASKVDVLKGGLMGFSILPVFLFVGIKGGATWYKRFWAWLLILMGTVIIGTLIFTTEPSMGGIGGMGGMNSMDGMNGMFGEEALPDMNSGYIGH